MKKVKIISADDFLNDLKDGKIGKGEVIQNLISLPPLPGNMTPEIRENLLSIKNLPLERKSWVSGLVNYFGRAERNRVFRKKTETGFNGHVIVEEGDSWFQHPVSWDLIDFLYNNKDTRFAIYSLSSGGDTLSDIIKQNEIEKTVQSTNASAIILSVGGNDLFGAGNVKRYIEIPTAGMTAKDLVGEKYESFLKQALGKLDIFLSNLNSKFPELLFLFTAMRPHSLVNSVRGSGFLCANMALDP